MAPPDAGRVTLAQDGSIAVPTLLGQVPARIATGGRITVRPQDFANPEIATQILEAHGEDRGEGLHLYRFPVVFPRNH